MITGHESLASRAELTATSRDYLAAAIAEARAGLAEGGIPIGSVLVIGGEIVARGHNRRVKAEVPCSRTPAGLPRTGGRLSAADLPVCHAGLRRAVPPCDMCSGAALLYGIRHVIIGENRTFQGPEDYLRSRGVRLEILDDAECIAMMRDFIAKNPALWDEDIGR